MAATTADQTQQGPSLEDAAAQMAGLLALEDGDSQDQPKSTVKEARTTNGEGVADAEAETKETAADQETADQDKAEATDAEETEASDDQRPQTLTVTVDGKSEQITLEEAVNGYQRWSDYSRKTAELANQRRELEQTLGEQRKAVQEERQTYAQMLVALRDQLKAQQPEEPNWDEVYRTDPVGYARKRDEWRDRQEKVAAANYELSRLQQLQQQENAENLKQMVAKGRDKMLELEPSWKDRKVWEAERQAIVSYAMNVAGYSAEEISQAYDPRAIVTLNKARKYDELMANKPKPAVTRAPKVAAAGVSQETNVATRLNAAQQRLAKSGRIEDAAKVFEHLV